MNKRKMFIALATAVIAVTISTTAVLAFNQPNVPKRVVKCIATSKIPSETSPATPQAVIQPETPIVATPTIKPPVKDAHTWNSASYLWIDRIMQRSPTIFTSRPLLIAFVKTRFGTAPTEPQRAYFALGDPNVATSVYIAYKQFVEAQ